MKKRSKKKAAAQAGKPKRGRTNVSPQAGPGPSPAWLKMKAGGSRERVVGTDGSGLMVRGALPRRPSATERISFLGLRSKPLHDVEDEGLEAQHVGRGCPYCRLPLVVKGSGWPVECKVMVSGYVECRDTASAEEIGHHYACTFWDHSDGVPF